MLCKKYIVAWALCASASIYGALNNGPEIFAQDALLDMGYDPAVKGWCNEFLIGLNNATIALADSGSTGDILKVYSSKATGSADELLANPLTGRLATNLIKQVYQKDDVRKAFQTASRACALAASPEERKKLWTTFRTLFRDGVSAETAAVINNDEQEYWHPRTPEEHLKGPLYFLEKNMHLSLTPDQIELIRAESLVYFVARARHRARDLETDDQFAVLSQEAQQQWDGSSK